MSRKRGLWCTTLVVACGALFACGGERPTGPRLVILYAPCSVNRSFLAPYEPAITFTPELAAFARESVVFRRHVTESGQSGVDFAALFSGTQADVHGVYHHPTALRPELQLVTETFLEGGYEVYAWSGHAMASVKLGYAQGVPANQAHVIRGGRKHRMLQEGDEEFCSLLSALAADPERHALVVANFTVTHNPYHKQLQDGALEQFLAAHPERARGVTEEELRRWLPLYEEQMFGLEWDFPATVAKLGLAPQEVERLAAVLEVAYEADVAELDTLFGAMLRTLRGYGLDDEALVAFTADHGEVLRRENARFQWTHGMELAPEVLDIPLLIHAPGLAPGSYEGVSRSIDVYPTLAGLCGVRIPSGHPPQGVDLSPALRGERPAPEQLAFSHTTTVSAEQLHELRACGLLMRYYPRTDPELIWARVRKKDLVVKLENLDEKGFGYEAFDLARDPRETTNLFDASSPEHAELAAELERYKRRLVERFAGSNSDSGNELTSEERLRYLRELGYAR